MTARLLVVGDVLLDRDLEGDAERVCPDAPAPVVDVRAERLRPGGAGLAAVLARRHGVAVTLVTALGRDEAGERVVGLLDEAGVEVVDLGTQGATPEKARVRARGTSVVRIDRGGVPGLLGPCPARVGRIIADASAVLVADYGRGMAAHPALRAQLAASARRRPLVWDPHPRGPAPVAGTRVVTPNERELAAFAADPGASIAAVTARARALAGLWNAHAVAVTMGARGALVAGVEGAPLVVSPPAPTTGDTCGAGDAFAAAATVALARGAIVAEAIEFAVVAASEFVARGAASGIDAYADSDERPPRAGSAAEHIARVRARRGTVVATGGCFDLLHAGHVATLGAARRLGDCLVVLLNSDASVRRLKGPDRPLQPQDDRAAVLRALDCVDAVEIFDEDTPVAALRRLTPDVFAKGGDYAIGELPESDALAAWGGQAVVLPYLSGRSTTRLVEEVRRVR